MTVSTRKSLLETVLLENNQHFLRVSQVRDLLVELLEDFDGDKARLRRWIYATFEAMHKQGKIEKRLDGQSNRAVYRYTCSKNDLMEDTHASSGDEPPEPAELSELPESLVRIKELLYESRNQSHIVIGQLNTCKKMREVPGLRSYADEKYSEIRAISLELAGRIKVLEETLVDHGQVYN